MHELDDFWWQPCFEQNLHEQMGGVRHILGRLEDHGVAAEERRKHLPRRNRERKVERRDQSRDADRRR